MFRVISPSAMLGFWVCLSACARAGDASPSPGADPAMAPKGTLAIGERITQPFVPLADIAKSPAQYANRVVATAGKVTAVCQEMGCWMELQDASSQAHVRMHGHAFFVPRTASGHVARVQATVIAKVDDNECEEGSQSSGRPMAKVDLDATGVELD
jgi:hypothetical protein